MDGASFLNPAPAAPPAGHDFLIAILPKVW